MKCLLRERNLCFTQKMNLTSKNVETIALTIKTLVRELGRLIVSSIPGPDNTDSESVKTRLAKTEQYYKKKYEISRDIGGRMTAIWLCRLNKEFNLKFFDQVNRHLKFGKYSS